MLLLIVAVLLVILAFFSNIWIGIQKLEKNYGYKGRWVNDDSILVTIFNVCLFIIALALFCALVMWVVFLICCFAFNNDTISKQIRTYQDRNIQIAMDVETSVNQYESSNGKTLTKLDSENNLSIYVNRYPDLESDATIQNDLQEHTINTSKISNLSLQFVDTSGTKWWVDFGLFW